MATVAQPPIGQPMVATGTAGQPMVGAGMTGQPMFVPAQGVAPQVQAQAAPMPVMAAQPGTVMYYPQTVGGAMVTVRCFIIIEVREKYIQTWYL